jgi:peptide deformylase
MAVRAIVEHPDPSLREVSAPVVTFNGELRELVDDLFDTLAAKGGIGLCAPQTGALQRVLVIHVSDDAYGPRVYINPELQWTAAPGFVEESCLSVPGIVGNVIRGTRALVAARDVDGNPFELEVDGLHAVCLQHEIDHLDGKLFIDRLSWFSKLRLRLSAARAARAARREVTAA